MDKFLKNITFYKVPWIDNPLITIPFTSSCVRTLNVISKSIRNILLIRLAIIERFTVNKKINSKEDESALSFFHENPCHNKWNTLF